MIKLVSKLGATSGLLTTAFVVDFSNPNNIAQTRKDKTDLKDISSFDTINTVEDIVLFERANKCSFGFVAAWGDKKVYKVEEFLEQHKNEFKKWEQKVIEATQKEHIRGHCKDKKTVALFHGTGKGFENTEPPSKW